MKRLSIGVKILALTVGIGVLMVILVAFYAPGRARQLGENIMLENARFITRLLSDNLALGMETYFFDDGETVQEALNLLAQKAENGDVGETQTINRVRVFNEDKEFVKGLHADEAGDGDMQFPDDMVFENYEHQIRVWSPLQDEDGATLGWVEIDFSKEFLLDATAANTRNALIIALIAFAVVLVLSFLLGSMIVSSLRKVEKAAESLAEGDLDVDVTVNSKDEVQNLAEAFNRLIASTRTKVEAANEIARGNYHVEFQAASAADELGQAMLAMRDHLAASNDEIQAALNEARTKVDYLDNLHLPVYVVTQDMIIAYINPAAAELMVGKKTDQCIGKTCAEVFGSENCVVEDSPTLLALRDGKVITRESTLYKHGREAPMSFTGAPVFDDQGRVVAAIGQAFDLSDIKNAVKRISATAEELEDGRLTSRVSTEGIEGDYKLLSERFNQAISNILEPVQEAIACLEQMAQGDLRVRVEGDYHGDHARIKDAMNATLNNLGAVLVEIREVAGQLALGAQQVADTSQSLSEGANTQSTSVAQITTATQEIASMAKENAGHSGKADALSNEVRSRAEDGRNQMHGMLTAMKEIEHSASEISKIIKVIDEIAFQTNLLALNAAVEAARAGVHGKGFAVVADEVRNLAQRSAQAARETTELIEETINRIDNGATMANTTADALDNILTGVGNVSGLISEITQSSSQQATAIDDINKELEQVDQVTKSNSAGAQELAASAQQLSSLTSQLQISLNEFKLEAGGNGGAVQGYEIEGEDEEHYPQLNSGEEEDIW